MKSPAPSPFKKNSLPLAITLLLHATILSGLLYFGKSNPLVPPKPLQAVLVTPEQLKQIQDANNAATASEQPDSVAAKPVELTPSETQQPEPESEPVTKEETPTIPDTKQLEARQAAKLSAQQKASEEAKQKASAQRAAEQKKALHQQAQKKEQEQKIAEAKAEQAKAAHLKAEQAKQQADAKQKTEDAKEKAAADAKAKAKAADAAKQKAEDAKEKAAADAKAKAESDAKNKADAEAKAKSNAKAEAKKVAAVSTAGFQNKMKSAWRKPAGCDGNSAKARVLLKDNGQIASIVITKSSDNDDCDASIRAAIEQAAPYDMPDDPEARKLSQRLEPTFK